MPSAAAVSWMDFVFAVRHPLSAPTWAKPIVILPSSLLSDPESAPELLPQLLRAKVLKEIAAAATKVFFTTVFPPHQRGCLARVTGVTWVECER
jgi:hypothetical protein